MAPVSTEAFVARGLASLGFRVERIKVRPAKTPDLLVSDATSSYLIEVKDKIPEAQREQRRLDALDRSEVWEEREPVGVSNPVSSVVGEACDQLAEFDSSTSHFRLVWLQAHGRDPDVLLQRLQATLLGAVDLIDLDEISGSVVARPCYFFDFAEFFRRRAVLDGAVISTDGRGLLCCNHLSPRYESFTRSRLRAVFHPGVCDPIEREGAGAAFIADCDVTRRDSKAVLEYVRQKYGRPRLIEYRPVCYSAEAVIGRD
jgi:hypothetical protein